MFETLLIAYILLLFVFPLPALAILLGLSTVWGLHRKYQLMEQQPHAGRYILRLNAITSVLNFLASFALGLTIAGAVNAVIFDFLYLFIFNFLFCFLISLRWFDFTHRIYRRCILKQKPSLETIPGEKIFVTLTGMRESSGFGPGLAPAFVDAGYLRVHHAELVFDGLFSCRAFNESNIARIEKKSSDKIRIDSNEPSSTPFAPTCLIALKDQFYPFKSRSARDDILRSLSPLPTQSLETGTNTSTGTGA